MLSFVLALLPLIVTIVGIIVFKRSGALMAVICWAFAALLAILYFHTDWSVALGASVYGIFKSFGVTIAVMGTMLMIFIMKEAGALETISAAIKRVAATPEQQAIFIGIGFGAFVTSLGVVTPSLFPPLLVALGFAPFAAVSIAVLGYNATCSFALLSIPLTLPADLFGGGVWNAQMFTYKVTLFLPVISILISIAMLWVIGGKESLKKGWPIALLSGAVIGTSCLLFSVIGTPVIIIGVLAGALTMLVLYLYFRATKALPKFDTPIEWKPLLRAISPWLILITIALIIGVPQVASALKGADGNIFSIYGKGIDLDILYQIYTWIFVATLAAIPLMRVKTDQLKRAANVWIRRIWPPVIAYALFFSVAYVMYWSAGILVNGRLILADLDPATGLALNPSYSSWNMNIAIGTVLASVFGVTFVYVAAWLGLFGAMVGGSEAGSNVLFYQIQRQVATQNGLSTDKFLTVYASHANAGGVASAITPSKINNAVTVIKGDAKLESEIMRKHIVIVMLITLVIGIMTGIFVAMNI